VWAQRDIWVEGYGYIGYLIFMKTTIDISDSILLEAKQLACEQNVTLRNLTEEGLRKVIEERSARKPCQIHPVTFQGEGLSAEFQGVAWAQMRDAAYEGRGA
jgi:hypothetical protein